MSDTGNPAGVGDFEELAGTPETERVGRTVWETIRRGAELFGYWLSVIFAIPSLILTAAAVAATAFCFGAGFGVWIPGWSLIGPGLLLSGGLAGMCIGALLGFAAGLIRLITPWTLHNARGGIAPEDHDPIGQEVLPDDVRARLTRTGRPVLRRIMNAGAGLILLAIPAGMIAGFATWKYLEEKIACAEHWATLDIPHWRMVDYLDARTRPKDEENSALTVDAAAALLPDGWPGLPDEDDPDEPMSEFVRAFQADWWQPTNRRLDPETAQVFRAELAEHEEAVHLARSLAGKKSGQHTIRLGRTLLDTPLPQSQAARQVPRLLQVDAAVRADAGDIDGALEDCRAILGVARSIGDEPFAISTMVRMAFLTLAKMTIERTLAQGQGSDGVLRALQAEVAEERDYPHLLQAMRGERGQTVELVRRLRDNELAINELAGEGTPGTPRYQSGIGRLWFHYQYAVALEWGNETVGIAHGPMHDYRIGWQRFIGKLEETKADPLWGYLAVTPLNLWPEMGTLIDSILRNQAFLATTEVYLAAERHRLATGTWPATIQELVPRYLKSIPIDPYNGGLPGYKLVGDRLIVHTIGPDRKDQGGSYDPSYEKTDGPDDIGITGWLPKARGLARAVEKGKGSDE